MLSTEKRHDIVVIANETKQFHNQPYLNSFTSMIIKAGLDAPHLGVGIAAGEAASYDVYKDIMDIVIEGWHGYKSTDSHKYYHIVLFPCTVSPCFTKVPN